MAEKREAFVAFLRAKYTTEEAFKQAWGKKEAVSFDEVPYLSKRRQQKTKSKAKAEDIKEFWRSQKEEPIEEEEEIE
jgi:uncharacterized protein with von Willebrand factor type A (vWA) domain